MIVYNTFLRISVLLLRCAALFHTRLGLFFQERRKVWQLLEQLSRNDRLLVWVHASSLGEFVQVRPLLEALRSEQPQYAVLVTFFSPSGYKVAKDTEHADIVAYLPIDFARNMKRFFSIVTPVLGIVVKHELWPNMCFEAARKGIPMVSVGASFRPDQLYFRKGMSFFSAGIRTLDRFLVCDVRSAQLLRRIRCNNIEVVGDPRYDSVTTTLKKQEDFQFLRQFKGDDQQLLVLWGSIWPNEWKNCAKVIAQTPHLKHVIAPHEPYPPIIRQIQRRFPNQVLCYSNYTSDLEASLSAPRILLIDSVGMLAQMYKYAEIAYVGGGKRGALHNILEPAAYGVPVILWGHDALHKFPEAEALRQSGGAQIIYSTSGLLHALKAWTQHPSSQKKASQAATEFVEGRRGATQKIYQQLKNNYLPEVEAATPPPNT